MNKKITTTPFFFEEEQTPLLIRVDNDIIHSLVNKGRGSSNKNYELFRDSLIKLSLSRVYNGLQVKYIWNLLNSINKGNNKKVIRRLSRYLKRAENEGIIFKELKGQFFRSDFKFRNLEPCISIDLNKCNNNNINQAVSGLTYNQIKRDVVRGLNFKVREPSII